MAGGEAFSRVQIDAQLTDVGWTRLLIRYGVGVRTARTIELQKLDLDYFEQDNGA